MAKLALALLTLALIAVSVFAQDPPGLEFFPDELLDTSTCLSGRRQGDACCKATCAVCGGPDCNIDGMGESCCVTRIRASGRDCRFNGPPCVIPQISPSPTSSPTSFRDPFCTTGIVALNNAGTTAVCCPSRCGTCGGSDCASRPGGAISCCVGRIIRRGVRCDTNSPPCVLSGTPGVTPIPTTVTPRPPTGRGDPNCRRGFLGTNSQGTACCALSCGQCGGGLCGTLPGGATNCCINNILRNAPSCDVAEAPCVPAPTPSNSPRASRTSSPSPLTADPNCVTGIQNTRPGGTVCCASSCGMCGGPMCADLPGGVFDCCIPKILRSGRTCDKVLPPCVVVSVTPTPSITPTPSRTPSDSPSVTPSITPSPLTADPQCSTGIIAERDFGSVCCLASCLVCGGADCGDRVGGVNGCCIPRIRRNAGSCLTNLPPCLIQSPSPSPSATPSRTPTSSPTRTRTPTPTPSPAAEDPNCDLGIIGEDPELGRVCCQSRCGACGGPMCGQLPGGVSNCCIPRIFNSEQFCTEKLAPCVLERF